MSRRDARVGDRERRELDLLRRQHDALVAELEGLESKPVPSYCDVHLHVPALRRRVERVVAMLKWRELDD